MKFRCHSIRFLTVATVIGLLAACSPSGQSGWEGNTDGRLQVVATFSIPADFVARVGGDRVALRTLLPPGSDPHTFEATPSDGRLLSGADLIVEVGRDFEPWMDRLYRSSGSSARRHALTDGLALLPVDSPGHAGHDHGDAGEVDPHFWHDVSLVMEVVERLRDELIGLDPENADVYAENATLYLEKLADLDAWIVAETASLASENRRLFTTHDVFRYFAERYGFEVIGTALASVTTEVFDPSASQVGHAIQAIRAAGVPVVFPEVGGNPRLINRIARETGARVGPPLYAGTLSEEGGEASTYIEMMRYNVNTLVGQLASDERDSRER